MKVFMTGATGFIGSELARRLRGRGDDVVALVRTPSKATVLEDAGCDLIPGDLDDDAAIRAGMSTCEAVIHAAGVYKIGIPKSERPAMYAANVIGTERVLKAAQEVGIPRIVYVSTQGALGDTKGAVVDETHEHVGYFGSYYEETKYLAHKVALEFIERGVPCINVLPGVTYGPNDPSAIAQVANQFLAKKLPVLPLATVGHSYAHIGDIAQGILLALDKGKPGESYILGGDIARLGDFIATLAAQVGRKPPLHMPTFLLKPVIPLGPLVGPPMGFPPNLREAIGSDGFTFFGSHEKATRELGYKARDLDQGIKDMLAARNA